MADLELCGRIIYQKFDLIQQAIASHPGAASDADATGVAAVAHVLQAQHQRYLLWASSLGVTATGHASLNYRLANAPRTQQLVQDLLDELSSTLTQVYEVVAGLRPATDQLPHNDLGENATIVLGSGSEGSISSSEDGESITESDPGELLPSTQHEPPELTIRSEAMRDIMNKLFGLAFKIRSPMKRSAALDRLESTNPAIVDQMVATEKVRLSDLVRHMRRERDQQYSGDISAGDGAAVLIDRFARANTRRRQMFMHWRRQAKSAGSSSKTAAAAAVAESATRISTRLPVREQQQSDAMHLHTETMLRSIETSQRTPATQLLEDGLPHSRPQSVASVITRTPTAYNMLDADDDDLNWPDFPPSLAGKEFRCPYCFHLCPGEYQQPGNWRTHLVHDLRPFSCTHTDCQDGHVMFDSYKDWVQHEVSAHETLRTCVQHPEQAFDAKQFRQHILEQHAAEGDTAYHYQLAETETPSFEMKERCCPLCQILFADMQSMRSHMQHHLERIALFALPRSTGLEEGSEQRPLGSVVAGSQHQDSRQADFETMTAAGDFYDEVLDIDLDDGERSLRLPFQLSERIEDVIERFLRDNSLGQEYHDKTFIQLRPHLRAADSPPGKVTGKVSSQWYCPTCGNGPYPGSQSDCWKFGCHGKKMYSSDVAPPTQIRPEETGPEDSQGQRLTNWFCPVCHRGPYPGSQTDCSDFGCGGKRFSSSSGPPPNQDSSDEGLADISSGATRTDSDRPSHHPTRLSDVAEEEEEEEEEDEAKEGNDAKTAALSGAASQPQDRPPSAASEASPKDSRDVGDDAKQPHIKQTWEEFLGGRSSGTEKTEAQALDSQQARALTPPSTFRGETWSAVLNILTAKKSPLEVEANDILEEGEDTKQAKEDGFLLSIAMQQERQNLVTELLDRALVDIDAHSVQHPTALQASINSGQLESACTLVERGADVVLCGGDLGSCLYMAIDHGFSDLVQMLLRRGAEVDSADGDELSYASFLGHTDIVGFILDHMVFTRPADLSPRPLLAAVMSGHADVVRLLLDHGVDATALTADTNALVIAAENGHDEILRLLLDHDSRIIIGSVAHDPVAAAAKNGHVMAMRVLINIIGPSLSGQTMQLSLLNAATGGHVECVRLCLEYCDRERAAAPQPDSPGTAGETSRREPFYRMPGSKLRTDATISLQEPLTQAALCGQTEVVRALLAFDADARTITDILRPVAAAAEMGHVDVLRLLHEHGAPLHIDYTGQGNPLYLASSRGRLDAMRFLLDKRVDVDARSGEHCFALSVAAHQLKTDAVQLLMERGAKVNPSTSPEESPLVKAVRRRAFGIVDILIQLGADAKAACGDGQVLNLAVREGDAEVVRVLLKHKANVDSVSDKDGSALYAASELNHVEIVKMLLEGGANVNLQTGPEGSALCVAVSHGRADVVQLLLSHGASAGVKNALGEDVLSIAVRKDLVYIVQLLVTAGAQVNATRSFGSPLLCVAASVGSVDMIRQLREGGADKYARSVVGSPLDEALRAGHVDAIELLTSDYDLDQIPRAHALMAHFLTLPDGPFRGPAVLRRAVHGYAAGLGADHLLTLDMRTALAGVILSATSSPSEDMWAEATLKHAIDVYDREFETVGPAQDYYARRRYSTMLQDTRKSSEIRTVWETAMKHAEARYGPDHFYTEAVKRQLDEAIQWEESPEKRLRRQRPQPEAIEDDPKLGYAEAVRLDYNMRHC